MAYEFILPLLLRTASSDSGAIVVGTDQDLRLDHIITASAAPTTLTSTVEHTQDGGTTWVLLKAFAVVGAVGTASESIQIPRPTSGVIRYKFVIVGTSYTFSVALRRE